jgi:hypothetical protein
VQEMKDEFHDADCYLMAFVAATLPFIAESRGLHEIDLALSWLVTRGRYGLATVPGGRVQSFDRSRTLTAPSRGSVVLVRGLVTRRRWMRRPNQILAESTWRDDETLDLFDPTLPARIPVGDRQALAALHRAITDLDSVSRTQSLWQAIEAYAGGTKLRRKLFSKTQRQALEEAIPQHLGESQRDRLVRVYRELNTPPLMDRLRQRLDDDAVPVSGGELALLERLRKVRNDVTHGREPRWIPDREQLELAISVVSRMLVFRASRAGATPASPRSRE